MSEVRCPFCGKINTADAEVCSTCGSRLQALQNTAPEETEETPEWLVNLRKRAQLEANLSASTPPFHSTDDAEDEPPDWLQSLKEAAAQVNTDITDTGDQAETEETPADESTSPFTVDDQSWLRGLAGVTPEETPKPEPEKSEPESVAGPVDWARRLANEPIAQPQAEDDEPEDTEAFPVENGELLSRLESWTAEPVPLERKTVETPPPSSPAFTVGEAEIEEGEPEAEDFPSEQSTQPPFVFDSSDEEGSESPFTVPVEEPEEPEPSLEGFPDWMKVEPEFGATAGDDTGAERLVFLDEDEAQKLPEAGEAATEDAAPELESVFLPEEEDETEVSFDEEPEEGYQPPPFMFDDVPDWLENYAAELPAEELVEPEEPPADLESEVPAVPFTPFSPEDLTESIDLPDQPVEAQPFTETPAEISAAAEDDELLPAQLPGWVEAMRPVESVLSTEGIRSESEQHIERSGPLAGIPGTIPGEDLATRYHKPPVYSSKLQITEKQRLHANLLEAMIAETDEPAEAEPVRRARPSALPRLLVAALMIAAILYVLVTGTPLLPRPYLYPAETAAFQSTLQYVIESERPVLVVVDYQPAYSAELEAAANGPLQDLAAAGVGLAFVSTNPAGPVLGDRLADNLAAQHPAFSTTDDAINLGYLAGGSIGMQALVQQPSRAILSTFEGDDAWGSPLLSGIQSLDGFGGIIVLTDTDEKGRDWIEQVQPHIANTPMLMIASAQAAPLLQPYVQSGQLAGMLSGWYGGVSYNAIAGNPSGAQSVTWTAYQVGIALMVVLILVGALIQGIVSLISARKQDSGA